MASSSSNAFASAPAPKMSDSLKSLMIFVNKTEGRDKFCKIVQYASRFLKWFLAERNPLLADRFAGLFTGFGDARRVFRLFKSLNELHKILEFVEQKGGDPVSKALNVLSRFGYLYYWIFDNLVILSKIGFIKQPYTRFMKTASAGWFFGLVCTLVKDVRELLINFAKERRAIKSSGTDAAERAHELSSKRPEMYVSLVRTLGDLVTASNGIELPKAVFGRQFNDGTVGIAGLIAAILQAYPLWP